MIVKCEQCQTRFKIPDDKVTDKGVKVRCTKCSHTFRVTRDMAQPAAAPAASDAAPDPFARFGAPATPSNVDVTRPGVFALGVEATRAPEPPKPAPVGFDFASLAPPASVPPAMPPASRVAPPPVPVPPLRSSPAAMDFSAPAAPVAPPPVPRAPVGPPPAAASTPAFDFSSLGAPAAPTAQAPAMQASPYDFTQPAVPAFVPPVPPPPSLPGAGFDFSSLAPPPQQPNAGFGAPEAPAAYGAQAGYDASAQQPGGYGGYNASAQQPGGYAGYDASAQQPGGYAGYDASAQQPGGYGAYDASAPQPGGGYGGYDASAQQPGGYGGPEGGQGGSTAGFGFSAPGATDQAPPAAGFDFSSVAPPSGAAPPASGFDFSALAPPAPAYPGGAEASTQQVPALQPDPFAAAQGMSKADARAMFDMPTAAPAPAASPLADLPPPEPEPAPAPPKAAAPAPAVAAAPPPGADEPRPRRNLVGVFVNVGIAAVLVVGLVVVGSAFLNEGKLSGDSLSLENLKNTFAPSTPFVARDVSNGLYETKAGRAVFFVRGEVVNHTDDTVNIVVRAELVEGETVVRTAESWAGTPPSPEELFLIDGTEALGVLNKKVEQRSVAVAPGGAAPFVVTFTEYPPDLKDFRVRVTARPQQRTPTAANP